MIELVFEGFGEAAAEPEIPVYDASKGFVEYARNDRPGIPVTIAGQVRHGIRYCDPGVEAAWRWADRCVRSKACSLLEGS